MLVSFLEDLGHIAIIVGCKKIFLLYTFYSFCSSCYRKYAGLNKNKMIDFDGLDIFVLKSKRLTITRYLK